MFGVEEVKRGTFRLFEDKAEAEAGFNLELYDIFWFELDEEEAGLVEDELYKVEDGSWSDWGRDEDGVCKDDCLDCGCVFVEADWSEAGVCLEVEGGREEVEWEDDVLYDEADWKEEEEDRDKLSLFILLSRFRFKEF